MMLHFIIKSKLYNVDFVRDRTEGFDNFIKEIERQDVDHLAKVAGVDKQMVKEAAIAYATAKNSMEFHGLGVTEQEQGSKTVMLIADLAMITGNIGRKGVGVNPLRGQNNVQGAADMGCQPHQGAGYYEVADEKNQKFYTEKYGVTHPTKPGLKIPEMFEAAINKELKVSLVLCLQQIRLFLKHLLTSSKSQFFWLSLWRFWFHHIHLLRLLAQPAPHRLIQFGRFHHYF